MRSSGLSRWVAVLCTASLVTTLAACGSDADSASSTTSTTTTSSDVFVPPIEEGPPEPAPCPAGAPAKGSAPDWSLTGATGSVTVIAPTETTSPGIEVKAPFSVSQTKVHTLAAGDGPVVSETARVLVCYMGVNGRDGKVFDSTYQWGAPTDFSLERVVTGFQKAIAGQTVGSTVAVAMPPEDGYPDGQPDAGILPGDSLIFAIKILDAVSR